MYKISKYLHNMCKYCEIFTHILYCNMFAMNVILKHVCVVVLNLAFCSIYAICRKFAFVAIYALFRVKFLPQKLWSCKFVDKYHVWAWVTRPECLKGAKDEVKQTRRAAS